MSLHFHPLRVKSVRPDTDEAVINNRLDVFDEATHPLVDYYRGRGLLHVVDADQSEDEVTDGILAVIAPAASG